MMTVSVCHTAMMSLLLRGVPLHLASSDARVRTLGMFVSETLTSRFPLNPNATSAEEKLQFEASEQILANVYELFHVFSSL